MRIAVLSDVHGNRVALEAVVEHLRRANPDVVVNLGDLVSGPFDPAGCADLLMSLGHETIAGNHERQLLESGTGASDAFARPRLTEAHFKWIAGLPATLTLADGEVFACHGSPAGGDLEYMLEDVRSGRATLAPEDAILGKLSGIGDARVVLCGHTHIPRVAYVRDVLIVNPGSVGMPAYSDDMPVAHVIESGAPHARYALLEKLSSGWSVDLRAVPYDFGVAARQAEQAGRYEVAYSLRTGRMPAE